MAKCDEDVVVLDTRSDAYSCLPEAAAVLALTLDAVEGPVGVLEDLAAAGLIAATPGAPRRLLPPLPGCTLHSLKATAWDELAVLQGMIAAWSRGPGSRPLSQLLGPETSASPGPANPDEIARLTAAFARRLPWDPAQGACLYRAWLLRRILRSRGQTATWVFGVKTWPFGAHCWLQSGDCVLDDDPDRVAQYIPIMAV